MKIKHLILLLIISLPGFSQTKTLDHSAWDMLLKKNVNAKGMVNYKGIKAELPKLDLYLDYLGKNAPEKGWSTNEKLAFWINAYNAFTVKLILDYYDNGKLKSIKDIGSIIKIPRVSDGWSKKFIKIGNKTLSLNNIENDIIRKEFAEARIHVALVCAAKSCPPLRNEAYNALQLSAQLDDQFRDFINDPTKNVVKANLASISPIFDWYGGDFTKTKPMAEWINKYAKTKMAANAEIKYNDYDWTLNEQ
jgi:Protein of unknown function, DUF547